MNDWPVCSCPRSRVRPTSTPSTPSSAAWRWTSIWPPDRRWCTRSWRRLRPCGSPTTSPWPHPRVSYMGGAISRFGDIHQAVGYRWTAEGRETLFLRSKVLIDARAAGIRYPVSGMWGGDRDDESGLRTWCTELRNLGYYGMMIGDPVHVPIVHEEFSPTHDEISYWQELDRLATEAERTGRRAVHGDAESGRGPHRAHRPCRIGPSEPRMGTGARPRSVSAAAGDATVGALCPCPRAGPGFPTGVSDPDDGHDVGRVRRRRRPCVRGVSSPPGSSRETGWRWSCPTAPASTPSSWGPSGWGRSSSGSASGRACRRSSTW